MSHTFLAVPDSPLVFRSGRPFGALGGSGSGESLDFPLPATTAGALRAAWCDAAGLAITQGPDTVLDKPHVQLHVRGPLRCVVSADGAVELWLPAPADALAIVPGKAKRRNSLLRLLPREDESAPLAGCDLPYGLRPLLMPEAEETQAFSRAWAVGDVERWIGSTEALVRSNPRTIGPLPAETRKHTAIDRRSQRAADQALFTTRGIDFTCLAEDATATQGLLMYVDAPEGLHLGLQAMAGRRRRLGADGATVVYVPVGGEGGRPRQCPEALRSQLENVKAGDLLRLYLATPACYLRNGWYPDGLRPEGYPERLRGTLPGMAGWRFELEAAAVGRFVPQAGYAMRRSDGSAGAGKPLRRLVPAGSVYWLRVLERAAPARPLHEHWWQSTCYVEFARDGHGLGLWGLA
jgi:CRISPR-associated protein Cmr3